jgi:endonuclease III
MRVHYTGFMARNTTPQAANKAIRKPKSGTPKSGKPKSGKPKSEQPKSGKPTPGKPRAWTPAEVEEAFRRFRQASPDPKTELQYVNPFTLLVAVVLSAQATDAGVNKATPALFAAADTPEKMAALGEDRIRDLIKTIGLYRNKAKNVAELSRRLVAEHGGMVPRDRASLEALPGVGRKTANVVLNVAFGEQTIAVDTHIFRVGNRTNMAPGATPLEVETKLEAIIPDKYMLHAHHWLILHGRYTCVARKPLCETCVINDLCQWPEKTV